MDSYLLLGYWGVAQHKPFFMSREVGDRPRYGGVLVRHEHCINCIQKKRFQSMIYAMWLILFYLVDQIEGTLPE
ncbi:hypothetical protein CMK12_13085 [Candidatus Poribacteria bacterium]|jgi:hypothetical protein|nr:hypothetical protein [Candidatus Poribacteria bacterium]